MAKLNNLQDYQDILDVFHGVISTTALERNVTIKILGDEKQKKLFIVKKASADTKHFNDIDVVIYINQLIFEKLETRQQILIVEEALAEIIYDSAKDSVTIKKPDYSTFSGIAEKYGHEFIELTRKLVKEIYSQEQDK